MSKEILLTENHRIILNEHNGKFRVYEKADDEEKFPSEPLKEYMTYPEAKQYADYREKKMYEIKKKKIKPVDAIIVSDYNFQGDDMYVTINSYDGSYNAWCSSKKNKKRGKVWIGRSTLLDNEKNRKLLEDIKNLKNEINQKKESFDFLECEKLAEHFGVEVRK